MGMIIIISASPSRLDLDIKTIFTTVQVHYLPQHDEALTASCLSSLPCAKRALTQRRNDIKQEKCRPHLPNCFGEVLQRADYFFITFSKGKVLDGGEKMRG